MAQDDAFIPIRDWPAEERPREKLLARGAGALSDPELLAIFLRTGVTGKSAVDLARDLIREYKGLGALLSAPQARFCASKGLGLAKYAQLQAVLEMSRRYLWEELQRGEPLTTPDQTRHYLKSRLYGYPHEVFACLFLDNRHRVLEYEELFRGTLSGASVHVREVAKRALHHNAGALILAHNHPSGVTEPSQADIDITRSLKNTLGLLEIRVLDHFIVGDGEPRSLLEMGLM